VGGIGKNSRQPVVLSATRKDGHQGECGRNFGMASPGGYRKAMRLMDHADRFPPAASSASIRYSRRLCGCGAEEQGQGEAIAVNLRRDVSPAGSVHRHRDSAKGGPAAAPRHRCRPTGLVMFSTVSTPWPARKPVPRFVWRDASKAAGSGGGT